MMRDWKNWYKMQQHLNQSRKNTSEKDFLNDTDEQKHVIQIQDAKESNAFWRWSWAVMLRRSGCMYFKLD